MCGWWYWDTKASPHTSRQAIYWPGHVLSPACGYLRHGLPIILTGLELSMYIRLALSVWCSSYVYFANCEIVLCHHTHLTPYSSSENLVFCLHSVFLFFVYIWIFLNCMMPEIKPKPSHKLGQYLPLRCTPTLAWSFFLLVIQYVSALQASFILLCFILLRVADSVVAFFPCLFLRNSRFVATCSKVYQPHFLAAKWPLAFYFTTK